MTLSLNIRIKRFQLANRREFRTLIRDLVLEIPENSYTCLVGPSGCGKSTLLQMIAGLDCDYEGSIHYPFGLEGRYGDDLAYVFQEPRLLPWKTVEQNILLARECAPTKRYTEASEFHALLDFMGLLPVMQEYPYRLSLGMNRRVALTRALVRSPKLTLLDEPLASLDAPTARRIRHLLTDIWQQQPHTVVHVTHDIQEALALADHLIFLDRDPMRIVEQLAIQTPRSERADEQWPQCFMANVRETYPSLCGLL